MLERDIENVFLFIRFLANRHTMQTVYTYTIINEALEFLPSTRC